MLLVALLHYEPARRALETAAPIMVSLIAPPALTAPPVPPQRPLLRARPQPAPRVVEQQTIVATPADPLPTLAAPPPEPKPAPPAEVTATPEPAPPVPITPPRFDAAYLRNPAPPYPPLARRMREQGKVVLRVLVSTEGLAERVDLKSSSGSARLDHSALATVKDWKFVPARQGGQAVAAWVLVPIVFALEG